MYIYVARRPGRIRSDFALVRDCKDMAVTFLRTSLIFISIMFSNQCVVVSSNWSPLTVYVQQYPWNPLAG